MAFTLETFKFLDELTLHNERAWFEANKDRYESLVREPALAFITAMAAPLAKVAPRFVAEPKKVGGSLMRIHRDTRFGKDKTPYKTNIGIHFRHGAGKDVHAPGFYVHVSPEECFIGLGTWRPEPEALAGIRQKIDTDPTFWKKASNPKTLAKAGLTAGEGEPLKRIPKGFAPDHPLADDLRRTSFTLHRNITAQEVMDKKFVAFVAKHFEAGKDYMRFLCEAVGADY